MYVSATMHTTTVLLDTVTAVYILSDIGRSLNEWIIYRNFWVAHLHETEIKWDDQTVLAHITVMAVTQQFEWFKFIPQLELQLEQVLFESFLCNTRNGI